MGRIKNMYNRMRIVLNCEITKELLGDIFVKYRTRSGRGGVFTSEVDGLLNSFQRGGIIILIINSYFHVLTPLWILPVVWLAQKVFEYTMGWYDEVHLHWWQAENRYKYVNLDPFMVELMEKINEINKKTKE